jgi:hypothetical protein
MVFTLHGLLDVVISTLIKHMAAEVIELGFVERRRKIGTRSDLEVLERRADSGDDCRGTRSVYAQVQPEEGFIRQAT